MNKNKIQHELVECIEDLMEIIKLYHEGSGEGCDHSVGICLCGEYASLDHADSLVEKYKK
jgi:hypothetical protein